MNLEDDQLVVRAGLMSDRNLTEHLARVIAAAGRPGICVMVPWDGGAARIRDTQLVPNNQVCLSTVGLLREHGLDELDWTQDHGNPYHFTLWLPDEPADTLKERVRAGFRGPFPKKEIPDGWTTDSLRGLQQPTD